MQTADFVSIVTSIGVLGTLLLGFANLYSLRKSEKHNRQYNLNVVDYEKRRDYILTNLSEYIQLLDAHELSFMALTDDEYEGKDLEIAKKLYCLETLYYKIKLMINSDNVCYEEFSVSLDNVMSLAKKIRTENSYAEFLSNGLRTPERAIKISQIALAYEQKRINSNVSMATAPFDTGATESSDKELLRFVDEAVKARDSHLENFLSAIEALSIQKAALVDAAQKYLSKEKNQALSSSL